MKRRVVNLILGFIISTALVSGCSSNKEALVVNSNAETKPEVVAPSGAKAIFDSGSGPTIRMSMGNPTENLSSPQKHSVTSQPATHSRLSVQNRPSVQPSTQLSRTESSQSEYMGISYWVELFSKDGQIRRVTPSYTFHSGDRIKLHLMTNRDGYLYLTNLGSTGRSSTLFPYGGIDNFVRAQTAYTVPYSGFIRFDENPGEEKLWVILSPYPLSDQQHPITSPVGSARIITASADCGYKDLILEDAQQTLGTKCGSKDLIVEDDSSSSQPAGYVVAPVMSLQENRQVISFPIKLKHQ